MKRSICLITSNMNKLSQFQQILSIANIDVHHENIDLPQIQGSAEQIVLHKTISAYRLLKKPVLVQDTSLCFNCLNGLPGPYVKWFVKAVGPHGLSKIIQPYQDKSAYALCVVGLMDQRHQQPKLFAGRTDGTIVQPKGSTQFGWDPIFQPKDKVKTYGEMSKQQKNQISHRCKAIKELTRYLSTLPKNQ